MTDAIFSVALETLRYLLMEEGKFLFKVRGQVDEVDRELNTMHSFLKDADERPDRYDSETVRQWVSELKDRASYAEDVLEEYAIKVTSRRESRDFTQVLKRYTCILSECLSTHHTGKEIEVVRSRMANLTQRMEAIIKAHNSSNISDGDNNQWLIRQTYAHQVEENFVGMEEDWEQLVALVLDGSSTGAISVWGMGGSGNTTIARKVYQDEDVRGRFEARAWVCVTQQFQVKTVLQQILKQLLGSQSKGEYEAIDRNDGGE